MAHAVGGSLRLDPSPSSERPTVISSTSIKRLLVDRDRLNMAPQGVVANLTATIFDRIQDKPKEHQLLAMACAFILMAETCRFPAQDAFAAASNLMKDPLTATGRHVTFDGLRYHLETETLTDDGE